MHWKDWLVVALVSLVGWLAWLGIQTNSLQTNSLGTGAPTMIMVDAGLFRGENELRCYQIGPAGVYSCPEGLHMRYGKKDNTLLISVDPWVIAQDKAGTDLVDIFGISRCLLREAIRESDVNFREWQACEVQRVNCQRAKDVEAHHPVLRAPARIDSLPDDLFCNDVNVTRKNWRSKVPATTMNMDP